MKRYFLTFAMGSLACLGWAQTGHGLVVAISDHAAQPAALRTSGAPSDGFRLSAMIQRYGIKVAPAHQMVRSKATGSAVRAAMSAVKNSIKSGDHAVFAYSGLGTALSGGRAGLAVFDSVAAKDDADLSMIELARWATEIEGKGGKVWFIVDAAWSPLSMSSREFEDLAYRNVTKFLERPGKEAVQNPVYQGPGIFLSASHASGAAYEWKLDVNDNQFAGAFSTQLVNYALRPLSDGRVPKFQDILVQLASEFRQRAAQGYMPGQTVWTNLWSEPMPGVLVDGNRQASAPFLGLARPPAGVNPPTTPAKFRLGFEVDPSISGEQARRTLREEIWPQFSKYVKEKLPSVELVEDYSYRPDRVVRFFRSSKGIGAVLSGSALEPGIKRFDEDPATGTNVGAVMEAEYADRGSRQKFKLSQVIRQIAAAQELFQLPDVGASRWTNPLAVTLAESFVNEQRWSMQVQSAEKGTAYVFARADWNGLISLVLPQDAAFGDTILSPNQPVTLPKKTQDQFIAYEEQAPAIGRVQIRVIVTDQNGLPGGGRNSAGITEGLEATAEAIRKQSCRWTSFDTSYIHKR